MAHIQQLKFVSFVSEFLAKIKDNDQRMTILEIGAHDVNGSVRGLFKGALYTGVDLTVGPGVDIVASGHELDLPDQSFDMTISCECFEHNPYWAETFQNMYRMTKQSGLVVITCASRGRLEHGTTRTSPNSSPGTNAIGWNYYRNLNRMDFERSFKFSEMFSRYMFFYIPISQDLYFIGWKCGESDIDNATLDLSDFVREVNSIKKISNSAGVVRHFFAFIERALLTPLTCLDDVKYQNLMQFYIPFRRKCLIRLKNIFGLN